MIWWFMTYYMLIFLLSPILNRGCESLGKNGFLLIISLLVLYQTISIIRMEPSGDIPDGQVFQNPQNRN